MIFKAGTSALNKAFRFLVHRANQVFLRYFDFVIWLSRYICKILTVTNSLNFYAPITIHNRILVAGELTRYLNENEAFYHYDNRVHYCTNQKTYVRKSTVVEYYVCDETQELPRKS